MQEGAHHEALPSKIERPGFVIVGDGTDEEKEAARKDLVAIFGDGHLESWGERVGVLLKENEIEKSEIELETIRAANDLTNGFLTELDLAPFDVPERNVHLVRDEFLERAQRVTQGNTDADGLCFSSRQAILVRESAQRENPLSRAGIIFHEMIHLKAFSQFRLMKDRSLFLEQTGLKTDGAEGGKPTKFQWLNEAVVESIAKYYFPLLLGRVPSLSVLADETYDSDAALKRKEQIAKEHPEYTADEIRWSGYYGLIFYPHSYMEERGFLDYIVEVVSEDSAEDKDEVLKMFMAAQFTGDIQSIRSLVDTSFGEGTLDSLDSLPNKDAVALAMDQLKGKRHEFL